MPPPCDWSWSRGQGEVMVIIVSHPQRVPCFRPSSSGSEEALHFHRIMHEFSQPCVFSCVSRPTGGVAIQLYTWPKPRAKMLGEGVEELAQMRKNV